MTLPDDAPPKYLPGLTRVARWSAEQWSVADAFGVAPAFAPPDEHQQVMVCPRCEYSPGSFLMARSDYAPDESFSGWVVQCLGTCVLYYPTWEPHVPKSMWRSIPFYRFMRMRPGLVRYLGLPVGFVVESSESGAVQVARRTDSARPTDNLAMRGTSGSGFLDRRHDVERLEPARPILRDAPDDAIVTVDFDEDADVWRVLGDKYARTPAEAILAERYRIGPGLARRTVQHIGAPAMLRERVRWLFRDSLPAEEFALVEQHLRAGSDWKTQRAAAMALRAINGKPFAPLMELVQQVQKHLGQADRGRILET
jgi:hypothetical protein